MLEIKNLKVENNGNILIQDASFIMTKGEIIKLDTPDGMIDELVATGFERPKQVKAASLEDVFLNLTGIEMKPD